MSDTPQSYENHTRLVTGYHRVAFPMVALPTLYFLYRAVADFGASSFLLAVFAVGTTLCCFYARTFPTGVQDRVIRLEERLRLERLLDPPLAARISELTTAQLVALRFASDEEVGGLVARVLEGELTGRKEIKRAIRSWRPDHERI